jgi:hypothetical protein
MYTLVWSKNNYRCVGERMLNPTLGGHVSYSIFNMYHIIDISSYFSRYGQCMQMTMLGFKIHFSSLVPHLQQRNRIEGIKVITVN